MDESILKDLSVAVLQQSSVNNQMIRCLTDIAKILPSSDRSILLDDLQGLIDRVEGQHQKTMDAMKKLFPNGDW